MPDMGKLAKDGEAIFAKLFEREMRASIERSYLFISMMPPSRPTVRDACAKSFPRLHRLVLLGRHVRETIAAARYKLGVAVIGHDPAPPEDD